MADDCCSKKGKTLAQLAAKAQQRRVLVIVMVINFAMFVIEFSGGVMARSSALMADSVDMFGDGVVYALSLYALSRGPRWEAGAALAKGIIILVFGIAVIVEIADKLANGVPPSSGLMLAFGSAALVANLTCLALLWRFRAANVNMSSTFECSRNDVISNLGGARRCRAGRGVRQLLARHRGGRGHRAAVPALGGSRAARGLARVARRASMMASKPWTSSIGVLRSCLALLCGQMSLVPASASGAHAVESSFRIEQTGAPADRVPTQDAEPEIEEDEPEIIVQATRSGLVVGKARLFLRE